MTRATRVLGWALGLLLAVAATSYAVWTYANERHDLPPFDHEKAKALSAEKRAEYERLLFNEITDWNAGSPRHDLWSREAEWKRMADDGYELAYITLQVLSPTKGRFSFNKPLKRLTELAESGDAGAMCLWFPLAARGARNQMEFDRHYRKEATRFLVAGALRGHPACLDRTGQRRLRGVEGFPLEPQKGFQELVASKLAGYGGGASLHVHFTHYAKQSAGALERRYCWSKGAMESSLMDPLLDAREIRTLAATSSDPALRQLAEKIKDWSPSVAECIDLGLGD